jgi:hypothetical protein
MATVVILLIGATASIIAGIICLWQASVAGGDV